RELALDATALGVRLRAALVLDADVDALHDDAAGLAVDPQDLARLVGAVLAGDHDDLVALLDVRLRAGAAGGRGLPACLLRGHGQMTSSARETIFMKLRSRSSRATAPKMRVPRGLLS